MVGQGGDQPERLGADAAIAVFDGDSVLDDRYQVTLSPAGQDPPGGAGLAVTAVPGRVRMTEWNDPAGSTCSRLPQAGLCSGTTPRSAGPGRYGTRAVATTLRAGSPVTAALPGH